MAQITTLDIEQLREVAMDDRALMRELVDALIDDTSKQVALLELAVGAEDGEKCKRLAHYSKGACASVGASTAASLLRTIEQRAAELDFVECSMALNRLAEEVSLLRQEASSLE